MVIELSRAGTRWRCLSGTAKLAARARLPGAFAFDQAAAALRTAAERGVPWRELLPLAFASSWLVNNAVPSPVFRRWLEPPAIEIWSELVAALAESSWLDLGPDDRQAVLRAATVLGEGPHGAGALSKVLALLVPDVVPLMPDAALWFALGTVKRSENLDAQTASVDEMLPMLDWFSRERSRAEHELAAISRAHGAATLSPAQVLDRLLWFDSAGYRHFRPKTGAGPGWYWVTDSSREGIVPLTSLPSDQEKEPLDLDVGPDAEWKDEARRALDEG